MTRAQVGQYQRASSGVPHERWCGPSTSPPVSVPPTGEEAQGAGQVAARLGDPVLHPRWAVRVGHAHHQALFLQAAQTGGQHVGRHPGDGRLQLREPLWTVEQGVDHQEGPAVADRGHGGVEP